MFYALDQHGNLIHLSKKVSPHVVDERLKGKTFYCPVCHEPLILKKGTKRKHHFAHYQKTTCDHTYGESLYHYYGKKRLYSLFHTFYPCQLEPYVRDIDQSPDLLLEMNHHFLAIEYQCANLQKEIWTKRTNGFKKLGYIPFWILGGNRMKRLTSHTIRLHQLEWLALRRKHESPYLLYYCPITRLFCFVSSISPFYESTCLASFTYIKEHHFTFHLLHQHYESNNSSYFKEWLRLKRNWRLKPVLFKSRDWFYVLQKYQLSSLTLQYTPSFCGIPLSTNLYIETPPIIWQSWIFIEFLYRKRIDIWYEKETIVCAFFSLVNQSIFQVRFQKEKSRLAIINYLNYLEKKGVIIQERALFKISKEQTNYFSLEKLLEMDEKWL